MTAADDAGGLSARLEALGRDDPLAYVFAGLVVQVEEYAEEQGWDQEPQLLAVQRTLLSEETQAELGADGGVLSTHPLATPIAMLDGDQIGDYLHLMAERIAASESGLPDVIGYILVHEGWAITPTEDDQSPTTSPHRIEVRFALGVDATGTAFQVTRRRGVDEPSLVHDADGEASVRGSMVEGLRELALASVAVPGA